MKKLRLAEIDDITAITSLIQISATKLGGKFYNEKTIKSALSGAFGVDTQLIKDNSYYVIEIKNQLIACGGWSYRKTLFGSDKNKSRDPEKLNPETDAANIRAFFIHPDYSRQGLGKLIIDKCEQQAKISGFNKTQLMATLSGIQFYKKNGYQGDKYIVHHMQDKNTIIFLPMNKNL